MVNFIEPINDMNVQENSEVPVVEEMEQSPPVQFQHKPTEALCENNVQEQRTWSEEKPSTPVSSIPANQPGNELDNDNKTSTISGTDISATPEARSQFYYRSTNPLNNYLHAADRRFSTVPLSPYTVAGNGQSTSNYEALYSSMNPVRSSSNLKSYPQYAVQDSHSYIGRYCPPSMVAGAAIYARNFYPSTTEHYRNEQLQGRTTFDRRFHNRVLTDSSISMLGAI